MPNFSSAYCKDCPYWEQQHLPICLKQERSVVPLNVEVNGSDTLLVFQAPGIEEWREGLPLRPTRKIGGTTGRRVELSWGRTGKRRKDYDITNIVQCFPGQDKGGDDLAPHPMAVCSCANWLRKTLRQGQYLKVISFGKIAEQVLSYIRLKDGQLFEHRPVRHPSRGMTQTDLDSVWD